MTAPETSFRPKTRGLLDFSKPRLIHTGVEGEDGSKIDLTEYYNPILSLGLAGGNKFREMKTPLSAAGAYAPPYYKRDGTEVMGGSLGPDDTLNKFYLEEKPKASPLRIGEIVLTGDHRGNKDTAAHEFMHRGFESLRHGYSEEELEKLIGEEAAAILKKEEYEHFLVQAIIEKEYGSTDSRYLEDAGLTEESIVKVRRAADKLYNLSTKKLRESGFYVERPHGKSRKTTLTAKAKESFLSGILKKIGFAEGGSVNTMENQMKMFEEGGIADDGMSRDPVSGNEIPSGSLASEVRDDIPTQLSEGEYVVPADVVRFFGVRVFEEMRMEAKMGLQKMEQDGRIGGEPIDAPAVTSNTDDLSPEEQQLLQEIMAMEQQPEPQMGMAPGGLVGGSYIGSNSDAIFSPTKVQDQFKTLGGSFLQTGSTGAPSMEGSVEPVAPVVNKVCPPGQIFSEKSQMCIISPTTYKNNDDDGGGGGDLPEPEDWGVDIDWTNSDGMTGYVDSVLTPLDPMLEKGLQIGGAVLGGIIGLGVAGLPVADAMNDLSNARATSLIARAMGDTATADAIDAKINVYVEKAPAMATSWLGNWLSSGTSRANRLAREMGFDNLADAEENSQAFADKLGRLSEEEVKVRTKSQADQITAAGVAPVTSGVNKNIVSAGVDKADATTAAIEKKLGRPATEADVDKARASGTNLLGQKLSKTEDQLTKADKVNRLVQNKKVIAAKIKSGQLDEDGQAKGGRNKGGLIKKRKKKK